MLPLAEAERLTFDVGAALADCYREGQRYREAKAAVEGCMRPRPLVESPCMVAYLKIAMSLAQRGHPREAEAAYQRLAAAGADAEWLQDLRKLIDSPPDVR